MGTGLRFSSSTSCELQLVRSKARCCRGQKNRTDFPDRTPTRLVLVCRLVWYQIGATRCVHSPCALPPPRPRPSTPNHHASRGACGHSTGPRPRDPPGQPHRAFHGPASDSNFPPRSVISSLCRLTHTRGVGEAPPSLAPW